MKINGKNVTKLIETLNGRALCDALNGSGLSAEILAGLVGEIRRCTKLIRNYHDPEFQRRRAAFFKELRICVQKFSGEAAGKDLANVEDLIVQIEIRYLSISDRLKFSPIGRRSPELRVSACLRLAYLKYLAIQVRVLESIKMQKGGQLFTNISIDIDGISVDPDVPLTNLSKLVAKTLVMEAQINQWLAGNLVTLPGLPVIDEEALEEVEFLQELAVAWINWEKVERDCRYLGGDLRVAGPNLGDESTESGELLRVVHRPQDQGVPDWVSYDLIANTR